MSKADGFDYTGMQDFMKRFSLMANEFEAWINGFLLNEGLRFIARVKPRTPVDTGDLREHWSISKLSRKGDVLEIWFVNPMYYATFVEYGHAKPYKSGATEGSADWVEGYFMMTVSVAFIERNMPRRFNQQFETWMKQRGLM